MHSRKKKNPFLSTLVHRQEKTRDIHMLIRSFLAWITRKVNHFSRIFPDECENYRTSIHFSKGHATTLHPSVTMPEFSSSFSARCLRRVERPRKNNCSLNFTSPCDSDSRFSTPPSTGTSNAPLVCGGEFVWNPYTQGISPRIDSGGTGGQPKLFNIK